MFFVDALRSGGLDVDKLVLILAGDIDSKYFGSGAIAGVTGLFKPVKLWAPPALMGWKKVIWFPLIRSESHASSFCLSISRRICAPLCCPWTASFSTFPLPESIAALTLVHYTHQAASRRRVAYFRQYASPVQCSAVQLLFGALISTWLVLPTIAHCRFVLRGKWQWPLLYFFSTHLFYFFSYFLNDKLQTGGRDDILSHQNVNAWSNRTVIAKS